MATKSSRYNPEEQLEKPKNKLEAQKSFLGENLKKGRERGSFKNSKRGSFVQ